MLDITVGNFGKLVIIRGKAHDFLGMIIFITEDKTIEITMKDQVQEVFKIFREELSGSVSSPATKKLMTVNASAKQLDNEKSDIFNSVTAKLLFITKRAKPDIETVVSFLTKRVARSNEDDWKKLKRVLIWCKKTSMM